MTLHDPSDDDRDAAAEAQGYDTPLLVTFEEMQEVLAKLRAGTVMDDAYAARLATETLKQVIAVSTDSLREARQSLDEIRLRYAINMVEVEEAETKVKHLETGFAGLQYQLHIAMEALQTADDRRQRLLVFIEEVERLEPYDDTLGLHWVLDRLRDLRDLPEPNERGTDGDQSTGPA